MPKRVTKKFRVKVWVGFIRIWINSSRELLLTEQLITGSVKVGGGVPMARYATASSQVGLILGVSGQWTEHEKNNDQNFYYYCM